MTTVDAALVYEPRKGWYLAPSPALEYRCTPKQAPPPVIGGFHEHHHS